MQNSETTRNSLGELGITFLLEQGAIRQLPKLLAAQKAARVFLIADKNTYLAAGERVEAILAEANIVVKKYVFSDDRLEPNESAVGLAIMHFDPTVDAVVAVGSGVINDISKIVANVSGTPYIIVATAANAGTVPEPHSASTWLLCAEAPPPVTRILCPKGVRFVCTERTEILFFQIRAKLLLGAQICHILPLAEDVGNLARFTAVNVAHVGHQHLSDLLPQSHFGEQRFFHNSASFRLNRKRLGAYTPTILFIFYSICNRPARTPLTSISTILIFYKSPTLTPCFDTPLP